MNYPWGLPPNDTSPRTTVKIVYESLQRNDCDSAQRGVTVGYADFDSPRDVLLFMAGVHLCRGDSDQARIYYKHALEDPPYGLAGLGEGSRQCDVYKSVASVLERAPRESFTCLNGNAPEYRHGQDEAVVDNPLTFDVDESVITGEASTVAGP